jgi:putative serine protease PepD
MADQLPPIEPRPHRGGRLPDLPARATRASGGLPPITGGDEREAPSRGLPPLRRAHHDEPPAGRGPGPGARQLGLAALIVTGLLVAGAAGGAVARWSDDDPATVETPTTDVRSTAAGDQLDLVDAVRLAEPSVVQVLARGASSLSQGSGVVTSPRGLIVTNEHVISAADEVTIVTADNRRIAARVVKSDPQQDLAILQPNGDAGPGARLADEDDGGLSQGDRVFAIGSPFDLSNSVTAGIVSAIGRRNENGVPMIQTDAPINPGNSGGGLFDLRGQLVGIPTSIAAPIPGNVGIGFAVPASRVQQLLDSVQ